jgi:AcrR family transcriptional regulator
MTAPQPPSQPPPSGSGPPAAAAPAAEPRRRGGPRKPTRPDDGRLVRGRRARRRIREAFGEVYREVGFDRATLRAIAERAGMGASSLYRHIRSKEELLIRDLAERQEEAWQRFRKEDDKALPTRERVRRFLDAQHALLAEDPDLTTIALRAASHPGARVARQVLALHDRTIGLLFEVLQHGRMRGDLGRGVDAMAAARAIFHITTSARIPWANGAVDAAGCRAAIESAVDVLFHGLEPRA